MKFATYRYDKNDKIRFGFKKDEHIIDIKRSATWLKEQHGKTTYLDIPHSLKEALKNWRVNFEKLNQPIRIEKIVALVKRDFLIGGIKYEFNLKKFIDIDVDVDRQI